MKFLAKNYQRRMDLENDVRNKVGLTAEHKKDHTIEGKREELANLNLTDRSIFWGIPCIITDEPTPIEKATKAIDRGKQSKFGINGRSTRAPIVGKKSAIKKSKKSKRQ